MSWRVASEIRQRTGHRFNIVIQSLPEDSEAAMTFEELFRRVKAKEFLGDEAELAENLDALEKRREIGVKTGPDQVKRYWATPRGKLETRKRKALIKLHTQELTENEVAALERMASKPKA
ncbi:hypothetical protein [Candidatus Hecatella orcuttiae]|jgi:hypothetical protein|uniref:hypothetical protein n=1 Tax=Candidatus Hecatella orcuttiae TaxID=1935119 RepID=UPI002867BE49|nr:hypothetical protein [Candidatus Hecatella orcuttiae]